MPLGILSGMLESGMQFASDKVARQENYEYWKKEQDKVFSQNQTAERNAVKNRADALRLAGLNPALAGNASPLSVGSAPMMNIASDMDIKANSKFPELALMSSQKDLIDEEARAKRIQNNRDDTEDKAAAQTLKSYARAMLDDIGPDGDPVATSYWTNVAERPDSSFNVGDVNAEMRFKDLLNKHVDSVSNLYAKQYANYMYKNYMKGKMPQLELKIKKNEARNLFKKVGEIEAHTALLDQQKLLTEAQRKQVKANINKLIREAQAIYHDDLIALWKDGDAEALGVKAGAYAGDKIVNFAGEIAKSYLQKDKSKKFPNSR